MIRIIREILFKIAHIITTIIGWIVGSLGMLFGVAIVFVVFGLFGYFILWCVKSFSMLFISFEWIKNEYVVSALEFLFIEQIFYTELVFVIGFGLSGYRLVGAKIIKH